MRKIHNILWSLLLLPSIASAAIIGNPTGGPQTNASAITELIGRVQGMVSLAAGAIAVAMLVYGAVVMGTAGGNEEKIDKGKKTLTYAIGGIILILVANILIRAFIEILGGSVS